MSVQDIVKESETLFITLQGKAEVDTFGDILIDNKAKEIVNTINYDFSKKKYSKFISIYMGIRAAIIDKYAVEFLKENTNGIVLHLGCGLDSRCERINKKASFWLDLDMPQVIEVRKMFYKQSDNYHMIGQNVLDLSWIDKIPYNGEPVLVIAEGLTMYLTEQQNTTLIKAFKQNFLNVQYVFDAYSVSAVKWSKKKNPVNDMGAKIVWGLDEPKIIEEISDNIKHIETKFMTGKEWEDKLSGMTKIMFKLLYGNAWANSLYRIYNFKIG